ncbi:hypothetical protein UFOVP851_17 [uncultured Caudovirales phage]|uniref:Uncharacterized protein n=1 Tax=uncultured Caudovirales phage TaxID=2100421 RepID=A0A6J5P8B0_9CAUD|nr:hypothetical protein UFOVP851_17 [uncultured Caudovirales phage]
MSHETDSETDLKQAVDTGIAEILKNPEVIEEIKLPSPLRAVEIVVNPPRRKDYSNQRYEKDPETCGAVTRLAKLGLSKSAVAIACRLSPNELTKWYGDEYAAGQAGMQEVVARGLMEQAMAGNPQVLMYLGKSKLGWTEANTVEHVGTINAVVSARPLSREEFEARYLTNNSEEEDTEA